MSPELKIAVETAESVLSETEQQQVIDLVEKLVAQHEANNTFADDLKNPEYKAYVEGELEKSEQDRLDGNCFSADEILKRSKARTSQLHG